MKVNELRDNSIEEVNNKISLLTKELFNLRFQLHTGRLENTSKLSLLKKDIARAKTVLREKRG